MSRTSDTAVERDARRARAAAEQLARDGTAVRLLRSIFVPEDEVCFYLYEASSAEAVQQAVIRAALPFGRVVEARESKGGER